MDQEKPIGTDSLPRAGSRGILVFIWGFILGVFISSLVSISPLISIFLILVGATILIAEKIYSPREALAKWGKVSSEVIFLSIALIAFGSGILRYEIKDFYEPLTPDTKGIVISEPEQRENTTRFIMLADNGEKVLVSTDLYSDAAYGDRIEIKGKFEKPGTIDDGVGRPFDYGKYLSKDEVYFLMNFTEVEIVSSGHGNAIKHTLFAIKQSIVDKVREIFIEPESSLLAGLILAGKSALPKEMLEEFRRAGIIHIVVLSGFNITIIADFLKKVIGPRASIAGILLFVIMTGAQATVVRAAIMVLIVIAAKMFRRTYSAPRALLAAGFFMVLHNPKILVFDPSFQLSFLATCALIYVVPIVEKYLSRVPDKWGLKTMIATTIGTQIVVLPLLIYSMGDVSLVSLPANLLVLLFIPPVMLVGFIATLVAYVSSILALPFSYFSHLVLSWILGVAHYLGNLSFATVSVPPLSIWLIALIYLVMIMIVRRSQNYSRTPANLG